MEIVDFDDRIIAYCVGCDAKIPPDEYDENDGYCELCQNLKERGLKDEDLPHCS